MFQLFALLLHLNSLESAGSVITDMKVRSVLFFTGHKLCFFYILAREV